ncbi:MAG: hypothetical protein EOP34_10815 [Rickettsiales bacterium]|nr:MAG: hypothetical protein EOP34_10815 [Rickettsiales bacterium]
MTIINTTNVKLINVLSKYSYSQISIDLSKHINKVQLDKHYFNNLQDQKNLIHNISMRLESLALLCCNLSDPNNVEKINKHYYYYWGSSKENAQMRGLQGHLAGKIFSEITLAANIDFSAISKELSAEKLGISPGLNTKNDGYVPRMRFPIELREVNSDSMKNAFEVTTGMIHSSVTGDVVIFTADKPTNMVGINKRVISNVPKGQVNNDIDRDNPFAYIKEEFKMYTANKLLQNTSDPRVVNVGNMDPSDEKSLVTNIASSARVRNKKKSNIANVDPKKNSVSNNDAILAKVEQTGDITDAREIIGIPVPYSNRFIDPNVDDN